MDFYIDVKYREVIKRTFPWFRKEKMYEMTYVCLRGNIRDGCEAMRCFQNRDGKRLDAVLTGRAIIKYLVEYVKYGQLRLFSNDPVHAMLFMSMFDELPYWMPRGVMDIGLYADYFILPRIDLKKLAEQDKIDFIETRPLSLQERREVIAHHIDYPLSDYPYYHHKFYTDLERDFIK